MQTRRNSNPIPRARAQIPVTGSTNNSFIGNVVGGVQQTQAAAASATNLLNIIVDEHFWYSVIALVIAIALLLISGNVLLQKELNKTRKAFGR